MKRSLLPLPLPLPLCTTESAVFVIPDLVHLILAQVKLTSHLCVALLGVSRLFYVAMPAHIPVLVYMKMVGRGFLPHYYPRTHLDLSYNTKFRDTPKLTTLRNVTKLYLCNNACVTDGVLREMTQLQHLYLTRNATITDHGLAPLTALRTLSLVGNDTITDHAVRRLTGLETLWLNCNKCITAQAVCALTRLTTLHLGSGASGVEVASLSTLTSLTFLSLEYNIRVRDYELYDMTQLRQLDISGSSITPAIANRLPHCKIIT